MNRRTLLRSITFLTGTTLAGGSLMGVLQACKPDGPAPASWVPRFLKPEEARFLTAYVDTLLPRTTTPGGLDVGVDAFIDRVLDATVTDRSGNIPLQDGMLDFDADATRHFGRVFVELEAGQREQLFSEAEKSPRYQPSVWGTAVGEQPPIGFYRSLKSMALWGYLSSEVVGTELMNYDPVPGEYDGDIALSSVGGRAWSL